jgi:hypothetical protein
MFSRKKIGALVIKPKYSQRTKLLIAVGAATGLVLLITFIYNYGVSMAGFERWAATRAQEGMQEQIRRLEAENQELREALARAQRSVQMSETAHQELDKSLQGSSQEIVKLREELNFYRNIISPADKKPGLRIQSLMVEADGKPNLYRYKLVLVQALKHERTIHGSASLEIAGMQAGEVVVLRVPRPEDRPLQVNFKYFQDLEGRFDLPKNFRPQQIKVNVMPAAGQPIEEIYRWPLT